MVGYIYEIPNTPGMAIMMLIIAGGIIVASIFGSK